MANIDPASRDPEFVRHRRECKACGAAGAGAMQFERRLTQAAKVDVPEDLGARILLRHSFEHRGRRRVLYTLTASVLVALGFVSGLVIPERNPLPEGSVPVTGADSGLMNLEQAILARMASEPDALLATEEVETETLQRVLRKVGWDLDRQFGQVRFGHVCTVGGRDSAHLVLKGSQGPITLMLIARQPLQQVRDIEGDSLTGVVVPIEGGNLAVVTHRGENLDSILEQVRSAVRLRL